jgi:ABC-type phosphate transport system substrate-binding protein
LLAPPLAKAWLSARGANGIKTDKIADAKNDPQNRTQVSGRLGGKTVAVNITGGGTTAGLAELAASSVDVVIASRPITAGEAARGDLRGATAGSLIGQGAVVVITARSGPATALTASQLQGLFSGKTRNWALVGGPREGVHLFGPREGTDVDSLFEAAILRGAPAGSIKRFDDGAKEDAAVAADPVGIGFIAMPLARKTRAVAIVNAPGVGATPGAGTKIESYPLSHPLWFYTAAKPANPQTNAFVQFALSDAGQGVVRGVGYAGGTRPPRVRPPPPHHAKRKPSPPLACPKNKVAMTDIGGARMTEPYDCTPLDH